MKLNSLLPLLTVAILLACNTVQKAQSTVTAPAPAAATAAQPAFVTWDKKMIDLGQVKKGETRDMFFELTNTSGQDIKIDIVDACVCTKVDFPRGVIPPHGKGRLDVVFDSSEKDADETIGITVVFTNTDKDGNPIIESIEYKYQLVQ